MALLLTAVTIIVTHHRLNGEVGHKLVLVGPTPETRDVLTDLVPGHYFPCYTLTDCDAGLRQSSADLYNLKVSKVQKVNSPIDIWILTLLEGS